MNPKIVFSDIDGTILNADRKLSKATIKAIERIKNSIPVILISSRMPSAIKHLQESAGITNYPLVAFNGSLIMHNNQVLTENPIPYNIVKKIIAFNKSGKVHVSLYNNNNWYVPREDYWTKREVNNTKIKPQLLSNEKVLELWKDEMKGAHKIMCMADPKHIDKMVSFMEQNFNNELDLYRSKSTYLEVAPKQTSKKTAITYILKNIYPQINIENAVAFGDNFNDAEMLNAVGISVAVANAKPEILKIAKHQTFASIDDGVATFLNENIKL